jgi:hypothetical protein
MSFTTIDPNKIKVGDPITKETLDLIKSNLDDHEFRITSLGISSFGSFHILNERFSFLNFELTEDSSIFYFTARRPVSITDFRVRLFTKSNLNLGLLSFRLQKSTSPQFSVFDDITSTDLTFDFAVDDNYTEKNASINFFFSSLSVGDIIRVFVSSHPDFFNDSVLISIGGE